MNDKIASKLVADAGSSNKQKKIINYFNPSKTQTKPAPPVHVPSALEAVHRQLDEDYPAAALAWLDRAQWTGPERTSLDDVDYSNMRSWRAFHNEGKVGEFVDRIDNDWEKPIILVRRPNIQKMMVADGHHRALAYLRLGRPPMAYVAHVDQDEGPWDEFHDAQNAKENP